MSRNALPNQEYIIVNQSHGVSKSAKSLDQPMVTILFKGVDDKKTYPTYIIEGFKNIKQWEDILLRPYEKLRVRFDPGWLKPNGAIDADSHPYIIENADSKSAPDIFKDVMQYDDETQKNIDLLKGLILIYQASNGNPETLKDLVDQCYARIAQYESGTA